ncbi:MAG: hypothetical protein ACOY0T_37335 [Myxococcota bacterium]
MVSRWLLGDARPNTANRPILKTLWNIPEDDWLTADERRRQQEALLRATLVAAAMTATKGAA